tara:strand:+ start:1352 stop:1633 length:282 start_codon:yes stop_codon:yes gene_type:complete
MREGPLFKMDFAANDFECWGASDQCFSRKFNIALWTMNFIVCEIFNYSLFKAFDQRAFAAFSIFKELGSTFCAENINRSYRTFLIRFCHSDYL